MQANCPRLYRLVAIDIGRIAYGTLRGDEFQMVFNNLNMGCFVKLQLNWDSEDRSTSLGCALCSKNMTFEYLRTSEDDFVVHAVIDEGPLIPFLLHNAKHVPGLYGLCIYIYTRHIWFVERSKNLDKRSCTQASITSTCPSIDYQMCGLVHIPSEIYKTLSKCLAIILPNIFIVVPRSSLVQQG